MLAEGLKNLGMVITARFLHPSPFGVDDHVLTLLPLKLGIHEFVVRIALRHEGRQEVSSTKGCLDHVTHLGVCDGDFECDWTVYRVLEASSVHPLVFLKPLPELKRMAAQRTPYPTKK